MYLEVQKHVIKSSFLYMFLEYLTSVNLLLNF